MTRLRPSKNKEQWPRKAVKSVECRKRDIVVRVTDWWSDRDEPAFDVEVYIGGVYDFNRSKSFTKSVGRDANGNRTGGYTKAQAKSQAALFAYHMIAYNL